MESVNKCSKEPGHLKQHITVTLAHLLFLLFVVVLLCSDLALILVKYFIIPI